MACTLITFHIQYVSKLSLLNCILFLSRYLTDFNPSSYHQELHQITFDFFDKHKYHCLFKQFTDMYKETYCRQMANVTVDDKSLFRIKRSSVWGYDSFD